MQKTLSNLALVFQDEIRNYNSLLNVLYNERVLLLESEISKLADLLKEENEIIVQIKECEQRRNKLFDELAEISGFSVQELVSTKLIDLADSPLSETFSEIFLEIKQLASEFKLINQCNRELIISHREYIKFVIELVSKYDVPGRTYSQDGTIQERESMSLFDKQI